MQIYIYFGTKTFWDPCIFHELFEDTTYLEISIFLNQNQLFHFTFIKTFLKFHYVCPSIPVIK